MVTEELLRETELQDWNLGAHDAAFKGQTQKEDSCAYLAGFYSAFSASEIENVQHRQRVESYRRAFVRFHLPRCACCVCEIRGVS